MIHDELRISLIDTKTSPVVDPGYNVGYALGFVFTSGNDLSPVPHSRKTQGNLIFVMTFTQIRVQ